MFTTARQFITQRLRAFLRQLSNYVKSLNVAVTLLYATLLQHLKIGNLPFLQMLNEVAYANEEPSIKLRQTTVDRKKLPVLAEKFGNAVGAAYSPFDNMIRK